MTATLPELAVTTSSLTALEAIHRFGGELVSHGCHATAIFEAAAADPGCALAEAYSGALFLLAMSREGRIQAAPHVRAAEALASHASEREQMTVAAISRWSYGDERSAARLFADIVEIWPHDIVSAKLAQILQLGLGEFSAMRRTASLAAAAERDSGYAQGLLAFALEQLGDTARAGPLARRAIDRNPDTDPWAQHAYAHVLAARGETVHGRAFLRAHAPSWDRCSSFMLTHNWWHTALFAIELEDLAGALTLFDERVWGVRKAHCQDQVNAISLLARLEMHGVDAGGRWQDIATHAAERAEDRVSGFLDLHYLYALARAGDDRRADALAAECLEQERADPLSPPFGTIAIGILAHARGDWRVTEAALAPMRHRFSALGGSQMQRALFDQLLGDATAHCGIVDWARASA